MVIIYSSRFLRFSLWYIVQNYLEDPAHNDFTEIEGNSELLLKLREELIDMVSFLVVKGISY